MKNTIAALLLASLLCPMLLGCASEAPADNSAQTTAADAGVTEAETTTAAAETGYTLDLPEKDYDGYGFRIMSRNEKHVKWWAIDISAEEENGEPINDAVYARNRKLEETLNVKIVNRPEYNPYKVIKPLIMAGEDSCDLITEGLPQLAELMMADYLADFNDVPYIDYDAPWWDPNITAGMSVKGKVCMLTGDITIMDDVGTRILCFNKDFITDFSIKDPYVMIEDGSWTLDEMYEMMKPIPADLDGDGVMGDFDRYAFVGQANNTFALLAGTGVKIASKDENDIPYLTLYNDTAVTAMDRILDIQNDRSMTLLAECLKGKYSQNYDECITLNFRNNNALFYMCNMKVVELMRDSDVNFGIIPNPKLSESQENYYVTVSAGNFNGFGVPITNPDLERTGIVTETMASYSRELLTPAYYEITLKGKSLRDEDSEAMLDLISKSRLYDIGMLFKWGGLYDLFTKMTKDGTRDFASRYAAAESAAQAEIDAFVESLK